MMADKQPFNMKALRGWAGFFCSAALALGAILLLCLLALRTQLLAVMAVQAQDSASSISLALQPHIRNDEPRVRDTLLTAIGQSGAYYRLTLRDTDGQIEFRQQAPLAVLDVPDWFQRLVPMTPPTVQTEVLDGWDITGTIAVSRHPAGSYRVLWRAALSIAGGGLVGLALATWLRRRRLRAQILREELRRKQMEALNRRIYQLTEQLSYQQKRALEQEDAAGS